MQDWPLAPGAPVRGVIIILHGLGEHAGRYSHVAEKLNEWGFFVRGYDQCGHGESGGAPGSLPTDTRLIDDLTDMVDNLRQRMDNGLPLILLGHSAGGLVATRFVVQKVRPVEGLILSSPAFDPRLSRMQRLLLAVLPRIAPNMRLGNGVKPKFLSHDAEVVRTYRMDRLVHDRVSARLGRFIASAGTEALEQAAKWCVPTLLMYAGDDRIINPRGSRRFASVAPKGIVTEVGFDGFYHEIFNEPDASQVFSTLRHWLDERF
jgi:alpha-beta hydrolase superfamily lysophospholipase